MNSEIAIINYGLGNIHSLSKAVKYCGFNCRLIDNAEELKHYPKAILPGVGAFPKAMDELSQSGMKDAILQHVNRGKYLLGICLGMQLLFTFSEEFGTTNGLGLLDGKVVKFDADTTYVVPQIQWNFVEFSGAPALFKNINQRSMFYFLHSYYVKLSDKLENLGITNYAGVDYISAIEMNNIMGVQFHPEKSGQIGLTLLNNFLEV